LAPPKRIPDPDDLLRHVRGKLLAKDPETDAPIGFTPQAFELRDEESFLSAAWPQYFEAERHEAIDLAISDMAGSVEVRPNDRFALGVVAEIRSACANHGAQVRIVHDADGFASHAAVRRLPRANLELQEQLAREAWAAMVRPSKAVVEASKRAKLARG
jgi:hypothetical protein